MSVGTRERSFLAPDVALPGPRLNRDATAQPPRRDSRAARIPEISRELEGFQGSGDERSDRLARLMHVTDEEIQHDERRARRNERRAKRATRTAQDADKRNILKRLIMRASTRHAGTPADDNRNATDQAPAHHQGAIPDHRQQHVPLAPESKHPPRHRVQGQRPRDKTPIVAIGQTQETTATEPRQSSKRLRNLTPNALAARGLAAMQARHLTRQTSNETAPRQHRLRKAAKYAGTMSLLAAAGYLSYKASPSIAEAGTSLFTSLFGHSEQAGDTANALPPQLPARDAEASLAAPPLDHPAPLSADTQRMVLGEPYTTQELPESSSNTNTKTHPEAVLANTMVVSDVVGQYTGSINTTTNLLEGTPLNTIALELLKHGLDWREIPVHEFQAKADVVLEHNGLERNSIPATVKAHHQLDIDLSIFEDYLSLPKTEDQPDSQPDPANSGQDDTEKALSSTPAPPDNTAAPHTEARAAVDLGGARENPPAALGIIAASTVASVSAGAAGVIIRNNRYKPRARQQQPDASPQQYHRSNYEVPEISQTYYSQATQDFGQILDADQPSMLKSDGDKKKRAKNTKNRWPFAARQSTKNRNAYIPRHAKPSTKITAPARGRARQKLATA